MLYCQWFRCGIDVIKMNILAVLFLLHSSLWAALGPQVVDNQSDLEIERFNIVLRGEFDQFSNHANAEIICRSLSINYTDASANPAVVSQLLQAGANVERTVDGRYRIYGAFSITGSSEMLEMFPWCRQCDTVEQQLHDGSGWVGPVPCCDS